MKFLIPSIRSRLVLNAARKYFLLPAMNRELARNFSRKIIIVFGVKYLLILLMASFLGKIVRS